MKVHPRKMFVRSLWMTWEKGYGFLTHWRSSHTFHYGVCTVMVMKFRGKNRVCKDGTLIRNGDWIGELHLDNRKVLELLQSGGSNRAGLILARLARQSMEQISESLITQPEMAQVKAVIGITLLHRGLTHGLGFEVQKVKSRFFERMTTVYLRLLLAVMSPEGNQRIARRKEQLVPMMLIHTRESLRAQFAG